MERFFKIVDRDNLEAAAYALLRDEFTHEDLDLSKTDFNDLIDLACKVQEFGAMVETIREENEIDYF